MALSDENKNYLRHMLSSGYFSKDVELPNGQRARVLISPEIFERVANMSDEEIIEDIAVYKNSKAQELRRRYDQGLAAKAALLQEAANFGVELEE